MKFLFPTIAFLFLSLCSYSQDLTWHYMYGYAGSQPTLERYSDIFFVNKQVGFTIKNDILKTTDGGRTWVAKTNFDAFANYHHLRSIEFLDDQTTGIAGTLSSLIYRTTDGGETWQDISLNIRDTIDTISTRAMCGLAHAGDNFYGVGAYFSRIARFYKSTNKGVTWTVQRIDTNLATQLIDVWFLNEDTGFISGAKTGPSHVNEESVVLKTTDGGNTWTKVFSDATIGGRIWKLQFLNNQVAFGSIEPKYPSDTVAMIRTKDGGNHWEIAGVSINQSAFNSVGTQGVGFATPLKGWIGGWYSGMFETDDGGDTWTKLDFGSNLNRFFVLDSNDVIACGNGIYRYGDTSMITSVTPAPSKKNTLHLAPIYPNPTDGIISIEFEVGFATHILLQVVSLDARTSHTVINKVHAPGRYTYKWDGSHLPNGQYMIWLDNDLSPITQKFIIHK